MKFRLIYLNIAIFIVVVVKLQGQTHQRGMEIGAFIADSTGIAIEDCFIIELTFDQTTCGQDIEFPPSPVYLSNDATNRITCASALSFSGLNEYIWIRKEDRQVEGSKWLLTRADSDFNIWTFPTADGDRCYADAIQWKSTDLATSDASSRRSQKRISGLGAVSPSLEADSQTHTFVPEPSSSLIFAFSAVAISLRRRRNFR